MYFAFTNYPTWKQSQTSTDAVTNNLNCHAFYFSCSQYQFKSGDHIQFWIDFTNNGNITWKIPTNRLTVSGRIYKNNNESGTFKSQQLLSKDSNHTIYVYLGQGDSVKFVSCTVTRVLTNYEKELIADKFC